MIFYICTTILVSDVVSISSVNRIRELPQNSKIVATHTDSPNVMLPFASIFNVFIWDVESQPNRQSVLGAKPSRPDLILTGHQDTAEYALAMCPAEPFVLSGGKDKSVVLWSISDHISSSLAEGQGSQKSSGSKDGAVGGRPAYGSTVKARGIFRGHRDTVEDVQFKPSSAQEFCSVGDDACLILWDARTGSSPVVKVEKAHKADVHCVDWNSSDVNLILTGSADNTVRMFDRRRLTSQKVGSPVHIFEGHTAAVLCVQWSPDEASVFGSGAEDGSLNIWDHKKIGKAEGSSGNGNPHYRPGLFFRHSGHIVSDDAEKPGAGWALQIWRMLDLIYRPEKDVLDELEKLKSHIRPCSSKSFS
ncbi:hypothetical protein DH2020_016244 [Rehmannia glutinosa]|uniref:Uncharacterized protein n=1 Tax=Rehmannia glutinosa TaxID=99300 RepID=A0ABR0WNL0_REHGL